MNIRNDSKVQYWTNSTATNDNLNFSATGNLSSLLHYGKYTNASYWLSQGYYNDTYFLSRELNKNDEPQANALSVSYTTTDVPYNRAWPLWMFWVVALFLVLGSIIGPMIGGRVFRMLARVSSQHRKKFRAMLTVMWLG